VLVIVVWMIIYAVVVAASIIFIGKPIHGTLHFKTLLMLLLDWRFLFGGMLALCARFIFVIINNLASHQPTLQDAHLTVAALATQGSIIAIVLANVIFLNEHLRPIQLFGAGIIIIGVFLVFR
jgi:drug/metabolite transporter (DMT)-like permease